MVSKIPGARWMYRGLRRLYVSMAETLGFVLRKEALVSRAYWERRAIERWDEDCRSATDDLVYGRALAETVAVLQPLKWNSLLEVGCGFGRVLHAIRLVFQNRVLVGGDFSFNQLRHGQTYLAGQRIGLAQVDVRHLPFVDKQFDVILTSSMLIYLHPDELDVVLKEFMRVGCRYVVLVENARDHCDTPLRKQLMQGAPFYGHHYAAAFQRVGLQLVKAHVMSAWVNSPDRLPLSLFVGTLAGANG